jgi:DNA-nicking Smr family endonuclease
MGGKKGRGDKERDRGPRPPKQAWVAFEDFSDADRVFQESLGAMATPPPEALRAKERDEAAKAKAAAPRASRSEEARTVDLHRMTLTEAQAFLDNAIAAALSTHGGPVTFMIITGKGLHSGPGGSVLPQEIHRYVRRTYGAYILRIEDSPADVRVGGLPLRGHFSVTLARK